MIENALFNTMSILLASPFFAIAAVLAVRKFRQKNEMVVVEEVSA